MKYIPLFAAALAVAVCLGCSPEEARVKITDVRETDAGDIERPPELSTKERMGLTRSRMGGMQGPMQGGMQGPMQGPMQGGGQEAMGASDYAWETPEGWKELPPSSLRLANLQVGGNPEAECYFTVLPGDGGGVAANVNRWRKQMGLEPLPPEEVEALPRRELLGEEAVLVDMEGAYGGMRGAEQKAGFRLLGLVSVHDGKAFFVKMVGPAEVVAAQQEGFETFYRSLHRHGGEGDPHGETAQTPAGQGDTEAPHPPMGGTTGGSMSPEVAGSGRPIVA